MRGDLSFRRRLRFPAACLALWLGFLLSAGAQTESFDRIAPKELPKKDPGTPVQPEMPVDPQAQSQPPGTTALPSASEGETVVGVDNSEVLADQLKALVFIPSAARVLPPGKAPASGITVTGLQIPDEAAFRKLARAYLDKPLDRGDLNGLIKEIVLYYRSHDRPVVDVTVPEQEITGGVVQLVIVEGRVGKITATGNRWFSSNAILGPIRLAPGDPIRASRLQSDVEWVNQNPFRSADVVFHPGDQPGQTDIELKTQDRFPLRAYLGYEDSGNKSTGLDRYLVGFNWGDAFGLGQQLNYQYTFSGDDTSTTAHSGSYIVPLPWRHTLTFFGSYASTRGEVPPFIDLTGESYQASVRYGIPIAPLWNYRETVSLGFDFKHDNNDLTFDQSPFSNTVVDVDQFVVEYTGVMPDPWGQTSLDAQFFDSPGGLSGDNTDARYNASHAGATADYAYTHLSVERLFKLPTDFSLVLRGTWQWSNGNLTPTEQLGFGGYSSVRGYDEREVNSDEGYILNTEVRTPPVSLTGLFLPKAALKIAQDQMQFLAFWDYGSATNHTLLPGETEETYLSSVGGGFRYSLNTYVSVRFDYGFQLNATGFDTDSGSRGHLGLVVSY